MKSESKRPVAIEDLLRLKRAERPPAEFWSTFDRELRAKQLSALVDKRPWWQNMPRLWSGVSRYRLPLGASAVLAIGFLSVREYQAPSSVVTEAAAGEVAASESAVEPQVTRLEVATPVVVVAAATVVVPAGVTQASVVSVPAGYSDSVSATEATSSVAMVETSGPERTLQVESPAVRYIAANLSGVHGSEPLASQNLLAVATGFETRAMPARVAVEPLQQMTPPGDTRRSRLLTAMVSTASLEASVRTTERAANRLAEERLYDQMSRFGARGDRVQVRF
jgi:hypothetical protein